MSKLTASSQSKSQSFEENEDFRGMLVIDRYAHGIFDYDGKAKLPVSVDMDRLLNLPGMQTFSK